ncbi:Arylsulfotransferase (ASST) [Thalassoglobus neptunius]|uniref:Arylsulfotransferase (ASST) n=1 Tax=Thalassoglobus neptunius TaxID=1938619 RepID=A0A5C5X712_9PLAN|nr:PQQ-binding-like beta-propeller repeat protein [Thalassoglobus neptunius]TWT58836.1 Arylsulfotransferase (ASST) [Thalassoglobus neptunius]
MKSFTLLALTLTCLSFASVQGAEVSSNRHQVIAADKGQIVRFDESGKAVWKCDKVRSVHRIQQLENGNVIVQQGWGKIVEIDPSGEIVWEYNAANSNGNKGKKLEVHAFQRLENGNTMIVENGIGRVIEVDANGKLVHQFNYKVKELHPHRDVRQAHKLSNGNYLVCHEADGRVTEYTADGEIVWDYQVPLFGKEPANGHGPEAFGNQVFNALRLPNGNTLIATGNGHSVLEVSPEKKILWEIHQNDLSGITLAWVTSLEVLPNGNIIIGNCHAGPENPQLIEVNRDKEVVWTFRDFENLGNATAASATVGGIGKVLR